MLRGRDPFIYLRAVSELGTFGVFLVKSMWLLQVDLRTYRHVITAVGTAIFSGS